MPPTHLVFGLEVEDSSVLGNGPVNVAQALRACGITFAAHLQNQRGALANCRRQRSFIRSSFPRGHLGDSWPYRGWVAGLSLEELQTIKASDKPDDQVPVVG
jgi:hypothetical protein